MFAHRLALALGVWDVDGMLRAMPITQWHAWIDYYTQEPFGEERADLRLAQLCALTANVYRGKGQKPYKPADFLFDFKPKAPQTMAQMKATLRAFTDAHNKIEEAKKRGNNR